jgi:hypothetical protein
MAVIHTLRDDSGGKAKVSVSSDVQPSAVRTVTGTVVSISRPLKAGFVQGNAAKVPAVGDTVVLTETPATRPRVPTWSVTASVTG